MAYVAVVKPPHAAQVRRFLDGGYPEIWIRSNGPPSCPSRSPELDFFL